MLLTDAHSHPHRWHHPSWRSSRLIMYMSTSFLGQMPTRFGSHLSSSWYFAVAHCGVLQLHHHRTIRPTQYKVITTELHGILLPVLQSLVPLALLLVPVLMLVLTTQCQVGCESLTSLQVALPQQCLQRHSAHCQHSQLYCLLQLAGTRH